MAEVVFLANLPGLQITRDRESLAGLTLYRLPFEEYDGLTAGAFAGYADRYRATEPVFLAWDQEVELPEPRPDAKGIGALQLKRPFRATRVLSEVGLSALDGLFDYMDGVVRDAWSVLSLAAPASSWIAPRYSVAFVHVQGGGCYRFRDQDIDTIQVQGEADQEYLFSPEFRSPPAGPGLIRSAAALVPLLETIRGEEPLDSALDALLSTQTPLVRPREQLTLCVMGLESLLLDGVRSQLKRTFAARLTALCGSPGTLEETRALGRRLYDLRSADLHGQPVSSATLHDQAGRAAELLAQSILRLASAVKEGAALDAVIANLADAGTVQVAAAPPLHLGARPVDRLDRQQESIVSSLTSTMGVRDEDSEFLWSPLNGLALENDNQVLGTLRPHLVMPLSGKELGELEDRDIRGDFLQSIQGRELSGQDTGEARSVLFTPDRSVQGLDPNLPMKERLRAQVDGAVLALRLAGLHRFADPELLGTYFYRGNIRFRRATVLRQTVLGRYIKDPDCLTETLAGRAGELLDLIVRCSEAGAHPHLAPFASLYRRAFHAEYLAGPVGANLVFAALEGLLGRFRPPGAKPQLEDLVECLAPEEPAAWFHAHGRRLRNDAAHGRWTGEDTETLGPLWSVLGAVLETYLRFLVEAPQHAERPARAFREQVESWI